MNIHLRAVNPATDFPRIAEINNTLSPEPITAELLQKWEQEQPEGLIRQWNVAVDESERVVGSASIARDPWDAPGRFGLRLGVDPEHRRQGIGTRLYTEALRFAQQHDMTVIKSSVRDDCPACLRFAEARSFTIDRHIFDSQLDLATFDEGPFLGAIEAAEATVIRFFSLADIEITDEVRHKLYDLTHRLLEDVPGWDNPPAPFEQWNNFILNAHWFRPDGQIIAADGDRWVGLAGVGSDPETNIAFHQLTGVDQEYRGRKLALALKLLAIRWAREWGVASIRTNNDSQNAPILAINRRLGYQPESGAYFLKHEAREDAAATSSGD